MCGIIFRLTQTNTPAIPSLFEGGETIDDFYRWQCNDEEWIKTLIDDFHTTETAITTHINRKLEIVSDERVLYERLGKAKNIIPKNEESQKLIDEQIKQLNRQIAELKVELEPTNVLTKEHSIITDCNLTPQFQWSTQVPQIAARGPNCILYWTHSDSKGQTVELFSSVLSLRQPFLAQPVQIPHHHNLILQFNGELYNNECVDDNDTQLFASTISSYLATEESVKLAVLKSLAHLDGEFAYVVYDNLTQTAYFGRDYVGKRSLVYQKIDNGITVSSVGENDGFLECGAELVYVYSGGRLETIPFPGSHGSKVIPFHTDLELELEKLIQEFDQVFVDSCERRLKTIHPLHELGCHIGILFSGGLDCTVIAGTIARIVNTQKGLDGNKVLVDLLTVGFDNPRTQTLSKDSPDRKLARRSFGELVTRFGSDFIEFHLVEVDVLFEEWLRNKNKVLRLIRPCDTEMDLSIAIAFYFASKGVGSRSSFNKNGDVTRISDYSSRALVLFSGLGADELFAGYLRHERIFTDLGPNADEESTEKSYIELGEELTKDIKVIHKRNLGRDDRAMSCWGKELRYPYLDENVIRHVQENVPINGKFRYHWATIKNKKGKESVRIQPIRKWLLREYANANDMGWVKDELKRAIQFGAKSAKMQVGQAKTKGTDSIEG